MFREIFDKSTDGMLIIKNGIFVECNQATVKMLRYDDKQQVIDTHPSELSPKYQADGRLSSEKADECIHHARVTGSNTFEWIHLRADGQPFWVEVVLTDMSTGDDVIILTVWREIGEKKRLEKENQYQKMILDSVINSSADLIFYKDYTKNDGTYIGCNEAFSRFVGRSKEKIIGYDDIDLFGEDMGHYFKAKDLKVIEESRDIISEEWVTYPDGNRVLLNTSRSLLKDKSDKVIGILGISRDMTDEYLYKVSLKENVERHKMLANIDPLTGISNKRYLFNVSEEIIKLAFVNQTPFSLLMIDIDHFKVVNDTYGHVKGDDLLKFLASTLKERLRKSDVFCRYGGEEFLVLLSETHLTGALEIAEELRRLMEKQIYSDEVNRIPITISIGVCQHTDETELNEVIEKADQALYHAKNKGRNRVESYIDLTKGHKT